VAALKERININILLNIVRETAYIFNESAIYILFGFLIAGALKVFIPSEKVFKHLGKGDIRSVLRASLLGIPLPLCSCAVLPTAISLRKQGASRGSTLSFLISTPETGVDSISITYALIDPVMTVFRPLSALITAITAGVSANYYAKQDKTGGIGTGREDIGCEEESCACEDNVRQRGKIRELFHYAYVEMLNDIAFWLVTGIIIAGLVSAFIPDNFFGDYTGSRLLSMLVMLIVGVPIYMCAASSTPIAAALILKGLNPGAALVFLLAGPATNLGTIGAVGRFLGKNMMAIYLGTIAVVSIMLGLALDLLYFSLNINPAATVGMASELIPYHIKVAGSFTLLSLMAVNLWGTGFKNLLRSVNDKLFDLTGFKKR
jgi:uncharacterized membrane protein YraQ (UPF0718 family)